MSWSWSCCAGCALCLGNAISPHLEQCQVAPLSPSPPQRGAAVGSNRTGGKPGPSHTTSQATMIARLAVLESISQPLPEVSGYEQCCPTLFWGCQHCLPPGPMAAVRFPAHRTSCLSCSHPSHRWTLHSKSHKVWQIRAFSQNLLHLGWGCPAEQLGGGWGGFKGAVRGGPRELLAAAMVGR